LKALCRGIVTIDATIIHAPSSTRNAKKERDLEIHQTKKGNQCGFEGRHRELGLYDGGERFRCFPICYIVRSARSGGDVGYQGQSEAIHEAAPLAQDMTSRRVGTKAGVDEVKKSMNRIKAHIRTKVEFRVVKCIFGFTRGRYRG
jgi:transposase, IS5 family